MKNLVIKIGGSLVIKEKYNIDYLLKLKQIIQQIKSSRTLCLVVGGGMIVRNYIKNLPLTNAQKEVIALDLIKANSRMLAYIMGARLVEAVHDLSNYTFTVLPALAPGQSTDADAAIAAEFLGAQLIILTDVGGIYDKDPKVHKDAKLYKKMTFQQLANFCVYQEYSPVSYGVLDHLAAKLIIRSEIETIVMSGVNPNKIIEALNGKVDGTIISKSD